MALGLKCGGTLEERSNRLFGTKGKKLSELDPNIFAKTKGGGSKGEKSAKESEKHKEIASMESQVRSQNIFTCLGCRPCTICGNHLNTRQVLYLNSPNVSGCQMIWFSNSGLKTGQKMSVLWSVIVVRILHNTIGGWGWRVVLCVTPVRRGVT